MAFAAGRLFLSILIPARASAKISIRTVPNQDPAKIALDIEIGVRRVVSPDRYEVVPDRETALARAVGSARPGDVVLVAGKGHETYQIFKDRTIDFDDRKVVSKHLALCQGGTP